MIVQHDFALWLYGSHARGDADEFSDLDVLVVSEHPTEDVWIKELIGTSVSPSVSRYSWTEIEKMAQYGSLFLRHVEIEGRPIFESAAAKGRLEHTLSHLGSYSLAARDLKGFRTVLRDVADSLESGNASLFFEMATLGTIFRHASILGCALAGSPCFSRNEPVARMVARWELPESWARDFKSLYEFRMYADNRVSQVPEISSDAAWLWCSRVHALLNELGRRIDGSD